MTISRSVVVTISRSVVVVCVKQDYLTNDGDSVDLQAPVIYEPQQVHVDYCLEQGSAATEGNLIWGLTIP